MKKLLGLFVIAGIAAVPISARAANGGLPGAGAAAVAGAPADTGADMQKLDARLDNAATVLSQIEGVKLRRVPDWIASKATCVAVVPGVVKGAFIVGAEYGQGVVSCRTPHGWSGPIFIRLAGGSWGFQIGGSGTDLVLVAINNQGMQDLLKTRFKLGGTAAVAAGPIGRNAQAATNLSLKAELLTYSRSHGLFAGVDLSGADVSSNLPDTIALYGGQYHNIDAILDGQVAPPHNASAEHFRHILDAYFRQAREVSHDRGAPPAQ